MMINYFFDLIRSLFFVSLIPLILWLMFKKEKTYKKTKNKSYKKKKKQRKSERLFLKIVLGSSFSLLILWMSSHLQIPIIEDLPNVLFHDTKIVEGNCKIDILSGRGGGDLIAKVRKHSIFFENNPYYKVKKGNYYCRVEYLPHSEMGVSLILYQSNGGKEIETK